MEAPLKDICVSEESPILQAVGCLNRGGEGIVLVTDEQGRLIGTVVDGDVRRALLSGLDFRGPVRSLLERMQSWAPSRPVVAAVGTDRAELARMMRERHVRQIPLVDADGRVQDLVTQRELLPEGRRRVEAVIMAGGFGTRLQPLTAECPKPLLKVGDQPLLSLTIARLREAGICRVNISTHYLAHKIREQLGDGDELGVQLNYLNEDTPLGTAGALGLMPPPQEPLLVINGDILTEVDFGAMMDFHREHGAALTVGVRQYDMKVPFGVVHTEGVEVVSLEEKPVSSFMVNAGIYLLDPRAHGFIPRGQRMDMTELIKLLVCQGEKVVSFPIIEYWLDIGSPEDYQRAQEFARNGAAG